MNQAKTFQEFLATQSIHVSIWGFALNIFLTAFLAFILGRLYIRYGTSLSNRRMFAGNFVLIATTTMLVIAIVKSSLALSLGLVGALSIVRFRSAIKEPEELAYLFLSIALGLGFGADQRLITMTAFCLIASIIMLKKRSSTLDHNQNLYVTVTSSNPGKISLGDIMNALKGHCSVVDLKRFDETKDVIEASFLVELENIESLERAKTRLRQLNDSIAITFLDRKGNI